MKSKSSSATIQISGERRVVMPCEAAMRVPSAPRRRQGSAVSSVRRMANPRIAHATPEAKTADAAIAGRIHVVRRVRVMLDADLAALYGVSTTRLNEAMRRNRARFPEDFMFQLTSAEHENLRSQIAISNRENLRSQSATSSRPRRGGRRYRAYVFTEQGVAMLSSVVNSEGAIAVNILIMRAFVQLRRAGSDFGRQFEVTNCDLNHLPRAR